MCRCEQSYRCEKSPNFDVVSIISVVLEKLLKQDGLTDLFLMMLLFIVKGVCLTLFIFVYVLKSAIFDQISQNKAYLAENTLKFCILSKNSEKLSKHDDFDIGKNAVFFSVCDILYASSSIETVKKLLKATNTY